MKTLKPDNTYLSRVHKLRVGKINLYVTLVEKDNKLYKVIIAGAHQHQDTRQFLAGIAQLINLCIKHSVPYEKIYECLKFHRGEMYGMTGNAKVKNVSGYLDAIGKIMEHEYPDGNKKQEDTCTSS